MTTHRSRGGPARSRVAANEAGPATASAATIDHGDEGDDADVVERGLAGGGGAVAGHAFRWGSRRDPSLGHSAGGRSRQVDRRGRAASVVARAEAASVRAPRRRGAGAHGCGTRRNCGCSPATRSLAARLRQLDRLRNAPDTHGLDGGGATGRRAGRAHRAARARRAHRARRAGDHRSGSSRRRSGSGARARGCGGGPRAGLHRVPARSSSRATSVAQRAYAAAGFRLAGHWPGSRELLLMESA